MDGFLQIMIMINMKNRSLFHGQTWILGMKQLYSQILAPLLKFVIYLVFEMYLELIERAVESHHKRL